ncbi:MULTISPECIES: ABC transporter permease [Sulfolobaceae]|uniref:ABC transporter permease n=1 Tax=Sulfolobaceae TaxID=118883 RepID=UPI0008462101|nr:MULTISPECIES: ABC transporter permease [unclassified Sulfolobus]
MVSKYKTILKLIVKDPSGLLGLLIVLVFISWSLIQGIIELISQYTRNPRLGYLLLPHNPFAVNPSEALHPPNINYIMGTNGAGEDVFSRILYALPRDALVAIVVVFSSILVGGIIGIIAGYIGGVVDEVFMRITDAFLSLPPLILVIAISVPLKASYLGVILGLSLVWWPTYARLFRAQTLEVKNTDYIISTTIYKVSRFRLFYKYIFLNVIDPIIAYATLDFGNVILTYSTLAFIGIGITPPIPELGEMASNGLSGLPEAWWWPLFPGLTILLIVIGFSLLGDRIQEIIMGEVMY